MRRFLTFSQRLRDRGIRQLKSDVCAFTKHTTGGSSMLQGMIAVHVGDILFVGSPQFMQQTESILRTFRAGTTELLTPDKPIAFLGIKLERSEDMSVWISQTHYIDDMPKMNLSDCLSDHGQIIDVKQYRTAVKQALGSLIWIHQTRPDIGFNITKLATDAVKSCTSGDLARKLISLYNKTLRYLRNHGRKIRYKAANTGGLTQEQLRNRFTQAKIITFSDAGYASLEGSHSIEGAFVILGQVISRDGIINCEGQMVDHRCAKIHRVCRSSLGAEARAAVSACDQALWLQMLMTEIATSNYDIRRYCPPTDYPIQNPFAPEPPNEKCTAISNFKTS